MIKILEVSFEQQESVFEQSSHHLAWKSKLASDVNKSKASDLLPAHAIVTGPVKR